MVGAVYNAAGNVKGGIMREIYLPEVVGKGYGEFWKFKGRYRVVKGSRASKKSKTAALWYIYNMMKYPQANLLVVRKTYRTLRGSCFEELKWAADRLGVGRFWRAKESPLEMVYIPTGQKIYFRGLDEPLKVTSITVRKGALCWMWIEEAYEITRESDFDVLDESIRGRTQGELFKQITLTFNPWNEGHWLKKKFFDEKRADVLALTTNYTINEFLDDADRRVFETMRVKNPMRYRVAGLGEWGVSEGCVFENWKEAGFDEREVSGRYGARAIFGLDFGYVNDPTALCCAIVEGKRIYVFDEMYEKALSNEAIYEKILKMGYAKEKIVADSAEPKSIERLRELGIRRIRGAKKGADSVRHGIDVLRDFEIIVHPRCVNFITEIGNYVWEIDRNGKRLNRPREEFNHLMDALRYAAEGVGNGESVEF